VNARYKSAIDAQFDKLKISSSDRQKMRYQQKLDHIRHSGSAGKMDEERRSLLHRIQALKNDVQVWENNIGFFAKSKNADKLKSEFEEKISLAKEEIKSLTSKLEMTRG
jgi:seryl-tRNA synthetase